MLGMWNRLGQLDAAITGGRVPRTGSDGVLMFHSVGDGGFDDLSPSAFRARLERLEETVTFVDLPQLFESPSDERRVAITFDDGYQGFYEYVAPILEDLNIPSTVFVVAGTLEDQSLSVTDSMDQDFMSRAQLAALTDNELVTIGNHTMTHPDLPNISSQEQLETEIVEARRILETELGVTVDRFCYPYNNVSTEALSLVKESHRYAVWGGGWASTLTPYTNPYRIPRVNAAREWWKLRWHLLDRSTHLARSIDEFRAFLNSSFS